MVDVDAWHHGADKKSSLSSLDWSKPVDTMQSNDPKSTAKADEDKPDNLSTPDPTISFHDFSTSLPALIQERSSSGGQSEDMGLHFETADDIFGPLDEELVSRAIGHILPREDELVEEASKGIDWMNLNSPTEESEFDLFSSGGGLEMDGETQEVSGVCLNNQRGLEAYHPNGSGYHVLPPTGPGSVIGEHPFGEHPSRTLFVRNINSNVDDSELRSLFEQHGEIRTLYTATKNRGFVMISYYDIRSARSAMRALQGKPLRRRKLDIHFSIPKDNPSDKDINQGTLVVFNLDASVSHDDLRQIFGHYGEVKEIRETPHKRHHKFIEFYDVRAAEAALRALNRSDIAGKRIKLEPSRPGGQRRSLMQMLNQDVEQEDSWVFRHQSSPPVAYSPPGHLSSWGSFGSPVENSLSRSVHNSYGSSLTKSLPGLPVPSASNNSRVGTIGSHLGRSNQMDTGLSGLFTNLSGHGVHPHHAHSLPEFSTHALPFYTSSTSVQTRGKFHVPLDSGVRLPKANSSDVSLFEHGPGALGMSSVGSLPRLSSASAGFSSLTGPQFLWGNTSSSYQQAAASNSWLNSSPANPKHNVEGFGQSQHLGLGQSESFGITEYSHHMNSGLSSLRHHVGSAPSGDPSYLDRHFAYFQETPEPSLFSPTGMMNLGGSHAGANTGMFEGGFSPSMGIISPRGKSMLSTSGIMMGAYFDMFDFDRGCIRRNDNFLSQADIKKQYQLDIDRILRGEDTRTTLMIKNIPNKYTAKMLLAAIDENHRGMYDFLYLPIDFKNKCNVGYAFINMTSPDHIISLYQAFNGKKWEKFNSEKVASLAYARIQGKAALVAHFQNSSLMNEDKRCRPILFNSDGPDEHSFLEGNSLTKDQTGTAQFMEAPSKAGGKQGSSILAVCGSSSGSPNN
ncbi:hypothetical protein KP509_38G028500 [Ceratopteris richardii]|uniref:RRM domain-containing protein n=1 Tax=Ceratopteris richardii TaxID=49495 RepID=A0A8T2Q3J6_CERRI|nr:hypothetical protein KP509_38G028500 [Ceratopteris richardii]KAH7278184.1 hypothetical protein KP509_38G028500 [Ceratopteris richardii]KAH7278185.1 hypothetical protein KP509_38G028500 [Ceratopteris richardii]KAH7278186.1 hypothetical protein KP509_38G028500 [Ceratopteris richardii]KAH7278187.1 hypothetical protein KP509_38G028500 [Ceratopteris richardii]